MFLSVLWLVGAGAFCTIVQGAALGVAEGLRGGLRQRVLGSLDLERPIGARRARWLTSWSAEFRYDDPPVPDELDRNASLRSAEQALAWARGVLADSDS